MKLTVCPFLLLFTLNVFAQESGDRGYIVKVGDEAPPFKFNLASGKTISSKKLKGKVVMLQFTASW